MSNRFELRIRGSMVNEKGEAIAVDNLQDGTAVAAFIVNDDETISGKVLGGMSAANVAGILYALYATVGDDVFAMAMELTARAVELKDDEGAE